MLNPYNMACVSKRQLHNNKLKEDEWTSFLKEDYSYLCSLKAVSRNHLYRSDSLTGASFLQHFHPVSFRCSEYRGSSTSFLRWICIHVSPGICAKGTIFFSSNCSIPPIKESFCFRDKSAFRESSLFLNVICQKGHKQGQNSNHV